MEGDELTKNPFFENENKNRYCVNDQTRGFRTAGNLVPTGNLVDVGPGGPQAGLTPPIVPDRPKREGQPPPLEQAPPVPGGLATAWGAPIPLTIKQVLALCNLPNSMMTIHLVLEMFGTCSIRVFLFELTFSLRKIRREKPKVSPPSIRTVACPAIGPRG